MPLLMNEDLLQDLVLYKKPHEKAVSTATHSLVVLFQESSDDELNTSNDEDGLPQSTLDSGDNIEALCESKENNGSSEDAEEGEAAVSDEEEDDEDADKLMDHTEGMKPDKVSAVGVITACGQLGALDQGHWVHSFLKKNKIMCDVVVQTVLVDMYMKCGSLNLARRLFESMTDRSVASWNVMIVRLGNNGNGTEAVERLCLMEQEGVLMNDLTFTACTHAGLVDKGLSIFDRMVIDCRIAPKVEHYGCVVDLLSRAGRFHEAWQNFQSRGLQNLELMILWFLYSCQIFMLMRECRIMYQG
ncbi:hypothetical protein J5N97_026173 [Dioscorea zingiberensis]|uniref:Pentatricopeptide repeat-containing protein n=1 Tax=Dioscorea zingiberensis TaxID=325984 RepID=A0A9D5C2A8_9LILI|nr:hypothetical protein J5N97_026173 [Dioscorea zingiberensis]